MAPTDGPYRICLATQGTRGDVQPLLALGVGLRKAGHEVFYIGNASHLEDAKEFGFSGVVGCTEVKHLLRTDVGRKSMETGDLISCFAGVADDTTDYFTPMAAALTEFKPEVVIYSPLIKAIVERYRRECAPELPMMLAGYQPEVLPSNEWGPIPLHRLELEEGQPLLFKWQLLLYSLAQANEAVLTDYRIAGAPTEILNRLPSAEDAFFESFRIEDQPLPVLLSFSEAFWPAPADFPQKNAEIVGRWSFDKDAQQEVAKGGGSFFDAGGEMQECADFINSGSKPVYIGWGSMTVYSDAHMARLAVGALKHAEQRGIIVAGWADLSASSLGDGPEAEELARFCEGNVLFMKAAPHEWLFPQCSCCVHHGGIGTVQASLGAGAPTIVTPVFADQHDIAHRITGQRWGLGTSHLSKVTAEELGEKIRQVCTDVAFKSNVEALAAKMAKEDGISRTVALLEGVLVEVRTGKFLEKEKEYRAKIQAMREKNAKFKLEQKMGTFVNQLLTKYPVLKEWNVKATEQVSQAMGFLMAGKLWYIKGSKCKARAGEKLDSAEVGGFNQYAFVELVAQKGSRLRVRRVKGIGPAEGWVSTTVKTVEIVAKVDDVPHFQKLMAEQYASQFADITAAAKTSKS